MEIPDAVLRDIRASLDAIRARWCYDPANPDRAIDDAEEMWMDGPEWWDWLDGVLRSVGV